MTVAAFASLMTTSKESPILTHGFYELYILTGIQV